MIIDIKEFALSGRFGPFSIGANKSDVISELGQPDGECALHTGSEIIYSMYELFFDQDEKLDGIQIDNYDSNDERSFNFENENFRIKPWLMKSPIAPKFKEVVKQLENELIEFEIIERYGRCPILLNSGVAIIKIYFIVSIDLMTNL